MVRSIVSFALGVIATTFVFLRWDGPATASDSGPSLDYPGPSESSAEESNGSLASLDERRTRIPESSRGSETELPDLPSPSPFGSNVAATGRTPAELGLLADQSFGFSSDNKDRHGIFANEERAADAPSALLENAILNRVWQVAGNTYTPGSVDAECRSSGCRAVLTYPSLRDAMTADMSGVIYTRLLPDMELHNLGAIETRLGHDGEGQVESVLQGPNINIFFWRRSENNSQSIAGRASGPECLD